ncbi:MAG TPA: transglutaminase domain-containing protein [Clostridia bacterium]|nr:transglutaminase domain-containing protein [Clostridia bacterium]
MKMRRFIIFLLIMIMAVSIKFPEVYSTLELPFNAMEADIEVFSTEEFEAVLRYAIKEVKESIKIRVARYDEKIYDTSIIIKKILDEDAGLGFVAGYNMGITTALGKEAAVVELVIQYNYPVEKVAAMRSSAESRANDIISTIIKSGMSDYEKVLTVHDYVVGSSSYDSLNADSDILPPEEHEAYGVLVIGTGVCDSYAKAFKLLLEKAGVQCMLVEGSKAGTTGQRPSDTDHAWNIVRIDGEYYHVDTTWDDASDGQGSIELLHHYLNLSDEELQRTHVWDRSKYPECRNTKYNYHVYNKLFAVNQTEVLSMLTNTISGRKEKFTMKIADFGSTTYNIEKLIQKAAEKSKLKQGISARWIINEQFGIVDIEFKY